MTTLQNALNAVRKQGASSHLFEAEDESQEWPDLHAAIREARKAYQADGTMPDWIALDGMLAGVRRQAQEGQA